MLFGLFVISSILLIGELHILYGNFTLSQSETLKSIQSTDWLVAFVIFTVIFLAFFYLKNVGCLEFLLERLYLKSR